MTKERDFAGLQYNSAELMGLVEEMVQHHGKEYCVIPSTLLLACFMMATNEYMKMESQGPIKTALFFVAKVAADALKDVGFSDEETVNTAWEILNG